MIGKMPRRVLSKVIMICSFMAMLLINIFDWNFSSVALMFVAAVFNLVIFCVQGTPEQKGGIGK